jgi:hypothetical protein
MENLVKSLIKAKQSFGAIAKDRTNPHFKSKYATLDAILAAVEPGLHAHGLVLVQTLCTDNSGASLITHLMHESGEALSSSYPLPDIADPQKFGAAITHARRYAVCAILSVTADEDDDGNAASGDNAKAKPRPAPAAPPPSLPSTGAGPGCISAKQVQRLQIELRNQGYTAEMMAAFKRDLGVESAKQIQQAQWQTAMDTASDVNSAAVYRQICHGAAEQEAA